MCLTAWNSLKSFYLTFTSMKKLFSIDRSCLADTLICFMRSVLAPALQQIGASLLCSSLSGSKYSLTCPLSLNANLLPLSPRSERNLNMQVETVIQLSRWILPSGHFLSATSLSDSYTWTFLSLFSACSQSAHVSHSTSLAWKRSEGLKSDRALLLNIVVS